MKELISTGACQTIALVGISKNSGKTTLLNSILHEFPAHDWGVFSTGSDGEEKDRLFKTPKPQVQIPANALFCCDAQSLDLCGSKIQLLRSETYTGRKLYLAKAMTPLATQITGPSSVSEQMKMVKLMRFLGARKILIDGSLDRKSIALEDAVDALILLIGASFGKIDEIISEIQRLLRLTSIPVSVHKKDLTQSFDHVDQILISRGDVWYKSGLKSLINHEKALMDLLDEDVRAVYIPTSFTDAIYDKLEHDLLKIRPDLVFRHPECIKLSADRLNMLFNKQSVSCLIPFKVKAFALNSTAVASTEIHADEFRARIRQRFPQQTFIDTMELIDAG
jgi:hypothetical protein